MQLESSRRGFLATIAAFFASRFAPKKPGGFSHEELERTYAECWKGGDWATLSGSRTSIYSHDTKLMYLDLYRRGCIGKWQLAWALDLPVNHEEED